LFHLKNTPANPCLEKGHAMAAPGKIDIKESVLAIEKIEDPKERAEALAAEAEKIDPDSPLLREVFRLVLDADPSSGGRSRAYRVLLPKLSPDLMQQALDMIEKYDNDKLKAEELGFLTTQRKGARISDLPFDTFLRIT
jgi:hypothetical protein